MTNDALVYRAEAIAADASADVTDAERLFLRAIRVAEAGSKQRTEIEIDFVCFLFHRGRLREGSGRATTLLRSDQTESPRLWELFQVGIDSGSEADALDFLKDLRPELYFGRWDLLRESQRCVRIQRYRIAMALAKRVAKQAAEEGHNADRWRAEGQLGRVLVAAGKRDVALALWRRAFAEGSSNRIIAKRLTQLLELSGEWGECLQTIDLALGRIHDPTVKRTLSQRRARVIASLSTHGP
jgi:tetratricopeptide (TPR) repeat protein